VEDIGLFEAINTQRQTTRYKPDPVPMEAIETILDAATKAPNGSNLQPWEFVVITDRELIEQVGALYREAWLDLMDVPLHLMRALSIGRLGISLTICPRCPP